MLWVFLKSLFFKIFVLTGSAFHYLHLSIIWSTFIGVLVVLPIFMFAALAFVLLLWLPWFSPVFHIKMDLSSIEVGMVVARDDKRCFQGEGGDDALFLGRKGVVVTLSSKFVPFIPIEVEILKGKVTSMFFTLKVKVVGALLKSIVSSFICPSKVDAPLLRWRVFGCKSFSVAWCLL